MCIGYKFLAAISILSFSVFSVLPLEAATTDAKVAIVERLSKDIFGVRWLIENPALPEETLRKFAKNTAYATEIAINPSTPDDILAWYVDTYLSGDSGFDSEFILQTIPCNPNASASTLEKIWDDIGYGQSKYFNPMECILRNPNTPRRILEDAFPVGGYISKGDHSDDIVTYIGGQISTSSPSDAFLAADNIAKNPNAPQYLLEKTNLSAINPYASPKLLKRLGDDPYNEIRILVAGNTSTPAETLTKLAHSDDWWVRANVAGNPSTPVRTLYELYAHADNKVLQGTGHRHWGYKLYNGIAGNPSTPRYILEELAKSSDIATLSALASNPKLPERLFQNLFAGPDDYYMPVKALLASNPSTPEEILKELAKSENSQIRSRIATNPATPLSLLDTLSQDNNPSVRQDVGKNPSIFSGN